MKKLVCGLGDVIDSKWAPVFASSQDGAIKKAHKYCGRDIQKGFTLVVGEFDDYYRVNFAGQKVTK